MFSKEAEYIAPRRRAAVWALGEKHLTHPSNFVQRKDVKKKALRESDIEKRLVERVKALGGEVRKVKWIGRNGAPDRLVMLPWAFAGGVCRTIWVELKSPGKKAEPHQLREHKRMQAMGQRVEVVDSFERIEEILS